jgi:hypothetical protein
MNLTETANDIINNGVDTLEIENWNASVTLYVSWSKEEGFKVTGHVSRYSETIPATRYQPEEQVWYEVDISEYVSRKITVLEEIALVYGFKL